MAMGTGDGFALGDCLESCQVLLVGREFPMWLDRPLSAVRTNEAVIGGIFAQRNSDK